MRKAIAAAALLAAIGIFLVRELVAAIARFDEQVPWDEVDDDIDWIEWHGPYIPADAKPDTWEDIVIWRPEGFVNLSWDEVDAVVDDDGRVNDQWWNDTFLGDITGPWQA